MPVGKSSPRLSASPSALASLFEQGRYVTAVLPSVSIARRAVGVRDPARIIDLVGVASTQCLVRALNENGAPANAWTAVGVSLAVFCRISAAGSVWDGLP